jgi:hypothetical protein
VATDAPLLDLHKIPAFVSLPVSDRFGGIAGGFGGRNGAPISLCFDLSLGQ